MVFSRKINLLFFDTWEILYYTPTYDGIEMSVSKTH
jgi:hypothetical protein